MALVAIMHLKASLSKYAEMHQRCRWEELVWCHDMSRCRLTYPALTNKGSFPSSDTHTISGTGWEFGPGSQLAVILTWKLAGLSELRHRTCKFKTGCDVCRSTIQLFTRNGWGRKEERDHKPTVLPEKETKLKRRTLLRVKYQYISTTLTYKATHIE